MTDYLAELLDCPDRSPDQKPAADLGLDTREQVKSQTKLAKQEGANKKRFSKRRFRQPNDKQEGK